jgi:hypothetical protein
MVVLLFAKEDSTSLFIAGDFMAPLCKQDQGALPYPVVRLCQWNMTRCDLCHDWAETSNVMPNVMINFSVNLTGLRGAQITGKTLFPGAKKFKSVLLLMQMGVIQSVEYKGREGRLSSLCLSRNFYLLLPLYIETLHSQAFRLNQGFTYSTPPPIPPKFPDWIIPLAFLVF